MRNLHENFELAGLGDCNATNTTQFEPKLIADKISILNINIRSLRSNFGLLQAFLDGIKYKVSIIVVTETWLDQDLENIFSLNGYKVAYNHRSREGGGIAVFYLSSMSVTVLSENTGVFDSHEGMYLKIQAKKFEFKLLAVYRPPQNSKRLFIDFIKKFIKYKRKLFIVGDLNLNTLDQSSFTQEFNNLLLSKNFINMIDKPTRVGHTGTFSLLDHIWTNANIQYTSFVFDDKISDHLPTLGIGEYLPTQNGF